MTTKHTPAQIDVEPHVQGEIPDTGTYAGELYMLATPKRIRACNTHYKMLAALEKVTKQLRILLPETGVVHDEKMALIEAEAALSEARGEA